MTGLLDDMDCDEKKHWSANYKFLTRGAYYIVIKEFMDFDEKSHPIGETWLFLGGNYFFYDNGQSLLVSLDDINQYQIRMWDVPEGQGPILENLDEYLAPLEMD